MSCTTTRLLYNQLTSYFEVYRREFNFFNVPLFVGVCHCTVIRPVVSDNFSNLELPLMPY